MKIPKAFTNLYGKHAVRADQAPVTEVMKSEGPAVEVEQHMDAVANLD